MIDHTGQQLGNYRLSMLLGRGGFADVYLGEHIYLQTTAAIKVVQAQLTDAALEKFLVEARTIARLIHPNIVPVLEFGIERSTPYLVMSYAPHGSLRQRHPRGSRLAPRSIVPYVEQVATALQYAHDRQVIHCDVKPENMLLGQNQTLMLSDFGIAISPQNIHTAFEDPAPGEIVGTATYMAPEQFHGHASPASDQYALGIIIYEWFCGITPFNGPSLQLATQHIYVAPPPLREQVPALSPAIEDVLMQALAKDPQARFSSMRDFARGFKAAAATSLSAGPSSISLASSPRSHPEASLRLSSAGFPADGYISHTLAVPWQDRCVAPGPAASPARPSRRAVVGGLLGLTAIGLLTTLGLAMLRHQLAQTRTVPTRPRRKIPAPVTPAPDTAATAQALISAAETRPAITSTGPNFLDLFIRGSDNALWFKSYDGAWHAWESLGELPGDPAVVSWGSGRLDIFARGSDNSLQHKWFDGIWHAWETLGGTLTADPAVASSLPGRIDILVRGVGNTIYHNFFDGSWHNWDWQGGISLSAPSVTSSGPGRIDVCVRGTDNALWYRWFDGAWHDWVSLGGSFISDPSVTSWGPGRLDVFVRGSDNSLQHIWYAGAWSSWETLGGTLTSSPSAAAWGSSRIDIFARSTDNTLQHKWYAGTWSDWQALN